MTRIDGANDDDNAKKIARVLGPRTPEEIEAIRGAIRDNTSREHLDVKNGPGHPLYEQIRAIEARAKREGRLRTTEELETVERLKGEMRSLYDDAFERSNTLAEPGQQPGDSPRRKR